MLGDEKYPAAITSTFKRNVPRDGSEIRVLAALRRASDGILAPCGGTALYSNRPFINTWT